MRSGVGRIRHLSVKILWLQQQVEKKMVSVAAVTTGANIADLGTKRLPCHTMRKLMYMVGVYNGSEKVGAQEIEEGQQKKLIKGVKRMTAAGARASTLQLALLSAMIPSALSIRVAMDGASIFWRSSVEIPIWFVMLICITLTAIGIYVVKEIKGLGAALYSWRDLCEDMDSDDREVRRAAMRRYQRSRMLLKPSTYDDTAEVAEVTEPFQDLTEAGGVWTDQGPQREPEVKMRTDVLQGIAEHMKLPLRGNTIFHVAFDQMDSEDKKKMNEVLVNMLHYMNSGIDQDVRHSFLVMGIILKKIGARGSPFGSPQSHGEDEEEEEEGASEESEESKKHCYLQSGMDECSDPGRWMELHHFDSGPMEIEESEDAGPDPINWATANANQRREYENAVMEYRKRVERRLNERVDRAEIHNDFKEAEALRTHTDDVEWVISRSVVCNHCMRQDVSLRLMSHGFHCWKFGCSLVRTGEMSGWFSVSRIQEKGMDVSDELCGFVSAVSKFLFCEWPKAIGFKRISRRGAKM